MSLYDDLRGFLSEHQHGFVKVRSLSYLSGRIQHVRIGSLIWFVNEITLIFKYVRALAPTGRIIVTMKSSSNLF
jgi:hypothetical protein